jgi:hypothetical protein
MKRLVELRALTRACALLSIAPALVLGAWTDRASAQRARASAAALPAPTSEIDVVQLRDNFYVLGGAGGNILMQTGPEGIILVDSGSTASAGEVLAGKAIFFYLQWGPRRNNSRLWRNCPLEYPHDAFIAAPAMNHHDQRSRLTVGCLWRQVDTVD